jgi:GT2 family glycosyltransferase
MISIIIPTFNQLPFTRLCLELLKKYSEAPYELIVVDNGSTDGTADFLRSCPDVQLIAFSQNRGFAAACNAGLKASRGEYLVLLNNDIFVTPSWLTNLARVLDCRPDVGMVLPATNLTVGPQLLQVFYSDLETMLRFAGNYNRSDPARWHEVLRLPDYCLMLRREMLDKVGYLDEQFAPGYYEDDDYSFRARKAGLRLIFAADTFVHHFSDVTTAGVDKGGTMGEINRGRFLKKWETDPLDFFQLSLRVINPLPDGLVFAWGEQPYLFQGGRLRLITAAAWHSLIGVFQESMPRIVNDLRALYPIGPTIEEGPFPEGMLLAAGGSAAGRLNQLYIVHAGRRRPVKDFILRKSLLSGAANVFKPELLEYMPEGPEFILSAALGLPGGLLLQSGREYFVASEQMLRPLGREAARRWGYALVRALPLAKIELEKFALGPPILDYPGVPLDFKSLSRVLAEARYHNRQMAARYNLLPAEDKR